MQLLEESINCKSLTNKAKKSARNKRYYQSHNDKWRLYANDWSTKNPEKKATYNKEYEKTEVGNESRKKALKKYRENNKEKIKARDITWSAIKSGKLIKPKKCEECNSERSLQAHHKDYSKPLAIVFVCSICHSNFHKL